MVFNRFARAGICHERTPAAADPCDLIEAEGFFALRSGDTVVETHYMTLIEPTARLHPYPGPSLQTAGLRPTRQRLALGATAVRRPGPARHGGTAARRGPGRSDQRLAGHGLQHPPISSTAAGLLREVVVEPGRSIFDTNTSAHHHFYHECTGELRDIPGGPTGRRQSAAAAAGSQGGAGRRGCAPDRRRLNRAW